MPADGIRIVDLTREEAQYWWERCVADLDITEHFGPGVSKDQVIGDWWGAIIEGHDVVGLTMFFKWLPTVMFYGRAILPEHRKHGGTERHTPVILAKLKEVFPECMTIMVGTWSTNRVSLYNILKRGNARLIGVVPCGGGVRRYLFVVKEF